MIPVNKLHALAYTQFTIQRRTDNSYLSEVKFLKQIMETLQIEQLFKEKFATVEYNPQTKHLTARWKGFLRTEDVKKVCHVLLEAVHTYKVKQHLSDQTEMLVLSPEIQAYVAQKVLPEMEKSGLRKMAVQVSENVFAQAAAQNVHSIYVGKLGISTFTSQAECTEWLNK
jgi:hypothetical protein